MADQTFNENSTGTGLRKAIKEGRFGGWQGGGRPKGSISTKKRKKYTRFNKARRNKLLAALEKHGNMAAACAAAGVTKATVYNYTVKFPEFKEEIEMAKDRCLDNLEDEFNKRLYEGTVTTEYDAEDKVTKRIVKQDNDLLKVALRALCPERYSTPVDGATVNIEVGSAVEKLAGMLKIDMPKKALEDNTQAGNDGDVIDGEYEERG